MTDDAIIEAMARAIYANWPDCNKGATAALAAYRREAWRPMETAPKDGTPVLLFGDLNEGGEGVWVGTWVDTSYREEILVRSTAGGNLYRWTEVKDGHWEGNGYAASRWMPLPPPPEDAK